MSRRKEVEQLQAHWYQRLRDEGFQDIEDTSLPDRPLKRWDSFKLVSERVQMRKAWLEAYQEKAEKFYLNPDFKAICMLIVKHGNSRFEAYQVSMIWEMHLKGLTEREIAWIVGKSKTCIHLILERIRSWMSLVQIPVLR